MCAAADLSTASHPVIISTQKQVFELGCRQRAFEIAHSGIPDASLSTCHGAKHKSCAGVPLNIEDRGHVPTQSVHTLDRKYPLCFTERKHAHNTIVLTDRAKFDVVVQV
jgi:hypothetical protein